MLDYFNYKLNHQTSFIGVRSVFLKIYQRIQKRKRVSQIFDEKTTIKSIFFLKLQSIRIISYSAKLGIIHKWQLEY